MGPGMPGTVSPEGHVWLRNGRLLTQGVVIILSAEGRLARVHGWAVNEDDGVTATAQKPVCGAPKPKYARPTIQP